MQLAEYRPSVGWLVDSFVRVCPSHCLPPPPPSLPPFVPRRRRRRTLLVVFVVVVVAVVVVVVVAIVVVVNELRDDPQTNRQSARRDNYANTEHKANRTNFVVRISRPEEHKTSVYASQIMEASIVVVVVVVIVSVDLWEFGLQVRTFRCPVFTERFHLEIEDLLSRSIPLRFDPIRFDGSDGSDGDDGVLGTFSKY